MYKDKKILSKYIISEIEKNSGLSINDFKNKYSEIQLFYNALRHVTTTKKALCFSLNIPVEAGCRYKRTFEKKGLLVQSTKAVFCPYTRHRAHLITTNPNDFGKITESNTTQLNLF